MWPGPSLSREVNRSVGTPGAQRWRDQGGWAVREGFLGEKDRVGEEKATPGISEQQGAGPDLSGAW